MTQFHSLDDDTLVAGQIRAEDVADAAAAGVTLIVNNRPDGEEMGQPRSAEIEAAAEAAGLAYRHIPVSGGVSGAQVEAMAEAFDEAGGKTLAFCRSGTRSTYLWALARSRRGVDGETLVGQAAAAGYDLGPIRAYL
jgi:uncharacterized protein (TIGR01244 family)